MAKMVCMQCKIIIKENIETSSGKDSHSLCPPCEAIYMANVEKHFEEKRALDKEKKRLADIEEKRLAGIEEIRIAELERLANDFV